MGNKNIQQEPATDTQNINGCHCRHENANVCQNDICECSNDNECQNDCEQDATNAVPQAELNIEQKYAELQDKHLRLVAEFDNFRKRSARERLDMITGAGEDIVKGLLPMLDDFERAIKSAADNTSGTETLAEGIKLIYHKTIDYLKYKGLQVIDPALTDFNTDIHDAVTKFPATTPEQKGKIIDTIQKGYKLGDKVIRYAKVVVGE
jgi:molecular chaperone GrpE